MPALSKGGGGVMDPVMSTALSGLTASVARLNVSASNTADSETRGPVPSTPPSQPLPPSSGGPAVYQAIQLTQTAASGGGVSIGYAPVKPSYVQTYDPTAPFADGGGMVAAPNVDPVAEQVEQITARASFMANLAVLKTADEMNRSLFDVRT